MRSKVDTRFLRSKNQNNPLGKKIRDRIVASVASKMRERSDKVDCEVSR